MVVSPRAVAVPRGVAHVVATAWHGAAPRRYLEAMSKLRGAMGSLWGSYAKLCCSCGADNEKLCGNHAEASGRYGGAMGNYGGIIGK